MMVTTDERFTQPSKPGKGDDPIPPFVLVVTSQGQVLRTPLVAHRIASTKTGRMYVRLNENDRVVNVFIVNKEKSMMLASKFGHIIHFSIDEVNILSGVGKGVMGIKLGEEDHCLGGVVISGSGSK